MTTTIGNNELKISVKHFGAVLTSVKSVKTGYEFLWQGDPKIWSGQSPILFPVIGKMLDDKYLLNGRQYGMIRHGLARHYDFNLYSKSENELVFLQSENVETLKSYPYKYKLFVSFKAEGNALTVTHTVKNENDTEMYFSIGAHPAFNCDIGDELVFEKNETLCSERIDENSVLTEEKDLILSNENTLKLSENSFDKDAMIFSGLNSKSVVLNNLKRNKKILFRFGDAPFFAIWAKPNAPYVCLEPWYGINDGYERKSDLSQKRGIQRLNKNESFSFSWSAEFNEI